MGIEHLSPIVIPSDRDPQQAALPCWGSEGFVVQRVQEMQNPCAKAGARNDNSGCIGCHEPMRFLKPNLN